MGTLYLICAVAGGTLLAIQTLMAVLGFGLGDEADGVHDAHDGSEDAFLKLLSIKAMVAFATFFGLGGLAAQRAELEGVPTLLIAVGAGVLALWCVAWLMSLLAKLHSRGNVEIANAVGHEARVYLRVPGQSLGRGKITIEIQGRTIECDAVTNGQELPTGATVRVVALHSPDTLEVVAT